MKAKHSFIAAITACVFALSCLAGCKKIEIVETTTSDVNIYSYLVQNPNQFSEFAKIVDKAGYSGFLNAYGAYTLFAPTNDGVNAYLKDAGKASVDAFSQTEAQDIVKLHLIQDTINTSSFTDGKLPHITMLGQYLLTGVANAGGVSRYTVNRQALIIQPNVRLSNGNVHVIDHVLKPAVKSVYQLIKENPDFSIFAEALDSTKLSALLNTVNNPDTTLRFLTVLAETNKALADSGITSFKALRDKYSQKKVPPVSLPQYPYLYSPANPADSVYLYVAYHIIPDAKYLADLASASSATTLAPLNVLAVKLDGQTVKINDLDFNGVHENGVPLDRDKSDVTATNGVVHLATAHFIIKNRKPVRVDFDVADQPELRKLTAVFRKSNTTTNIAGTNGGGYTIAKGFLADVTWSSISSATSTVSYNCVPVNNTTYYGWWADYLRIPMGNTSRNIWIEFRTPLLVTGKYKVWMCYYRGRASTNNPAFPNRVTFDGEALQRTFDFSEQKPVGTTGELEALGYKQYTELALSFPTGQNTGQDLNNVARLVGTVDVKSTDRHALRITFLANSTGQEVNYLDMIQFIPVDDNQQRPVFGRDGSIIQ